MRYVRAINSKCAHTNCCYCVGGTYKTRTLLFPEKKNCSVPILSINNMNPFRIRENNHIICLILSSKLVLLFCINL